MPTAMGIDVGTKLHVTIMEPKSRMLLYTGELKDFEEVDTLMLKFNTQTCVIDALPETRKVRELISRNKTKVWSCFYSDHQKGNYLWKEDNNVVMVNRTESLDAGQLAFIRKNISLPQRNSMVELFANHIQNLVKTVDEDLVTGDRRYVYKKLGPDHFGHSLNYCFIAATKMRGSSVSFFR